ncbi:hypothetical protein ACIBL3_46500 [Kribbella sp. NPDC050124]|uniref:hypothetical protein n=1 Tax=Kribbella sp. NPDC050124 TaxID=3364114 RepID=UPI00379690A5
MTGGQISSRYCSSRRIPYEPSASGTRQIAISGPDAINMFGGRTTSYAIEASRVCVKGSGVNRWAPGVSQYLSPQLHIHVVRQLVPAGSGTIGDAGMTAIPRSTYA